MKFFTIFVMTICLVACTDVSLQTITPTGQAAILYTDVPSATFTPTPADAPLSTKTPVPTQTLSPISTTLPSPTPSPQNTPVPVRIDSENLSLLEIAFQIEENINIQDVEWSPDGNLLAVAGARGVNVYSTATFQKIAFLSTTEDVLAVSFSPNSKMIASANFQNGYLVWEGETEKLVISDQQLKGGSEILYGPDNSQIITGRVIPLSRYGPHTDIYIWNSVSGSSGILETAQGVLWSLDISANNLLSAGIVKQWDFGLVNEVIIWDLSNAGEIGHSLNGYYARFSLDGKKIAVAEENQAIKIYETNNFETYIELEGVVKILNHISFSPDGKIVAAIATPDTVTFWDTSTGEELYKKDFLGSAFIEFSSDGKYIANIRTSGDLIIWSVAH